MRRAQTFRWLPGMKDELDARIIQVDEAKAQVLVELGADCDWMETCDLADPDLEDHTTLHACLGLVIEQCTSINIAIADGIFAATFFANGRVDQVWETTMAAMVVELLKALDRKEVDA